MEDFKAIAVAIHPALLTDKRAWVITLLKRFKKRWEVKFIHGFKPIQVNYNDFLLKVL